MRLLWCIVKRNFDLILMEHEEYLIMVEWSSHVFIVLETRVIKFRRFSRREDFAEIQSVEGQL